MTHADGVTEYLPVEQRIRPRGRDARYCFECEQIVDSQDDAEAEPCEMDEPT